MRDPSAEKDLAAVRREMRKLLQPLEDAQSEINANLQNLTQQVQDNTTTGVFAEIVNILNNSHPEWSKLAYTTLGVLPNDASDANLEAYNWYRQIQSATLLAQTSANALKAAKTGEPADHSLWAANEAVDADIPRYDKVNGTIELGGVTNRWDLIVPLPNDVVFPGQIFYVQLEAMLRTATAMPSGLQIYSGIFDNTVGQAKYIEGGTFAITDDQGNDPGITYGIPGATSVDYKVIAFTDSGEQAESNVLNFPNAPAVFDANNHPRIKFSGVPGFIKFEIYRQIGSDVVLQYTVQNTIEGTYYDVGNPPQAVVSAFPTITTTRPKAYAITSQFVPGALNGLGWVRHALTIFVPTTYDRGVTGAGMQYFRMGLNSLTTDPRQILIRRIGLSMGSGKWARSAEDLRVGVHSPPSSSATGAGSSGGGGIEPPPEGGGGECVLLDSILSLADGSKELRKALPGDIVDSGGVVCGRIIKVKHAHASRIFRIETESGLKVGCTFDHPFIVDGLNFNGTPCETLKRRFDSGETVTILTRPNGKIITDEIVSIKEEFGDYFVGMPSVDGPHTVILNGFLSHNLKPIE